MRPAELDAWVGREEISNDLASSQAAEGLAALLDHERPPWQQDLVPPLGHWLHFHPCARQSDLDVDGHPRRGRDSFLPALDLPRRMWAGSRILFHAAIPFGSALERRSKILSVSRKEGASGEMVFVTILHEISAAGLPSITEEQDIVYRAAAGPAAVAAKPAPIEPDKAAASVRTLVCDPVQLFRYSALTFNGHRIHYDRPYAQQVEHYPGLVVQGPYLATLLIDHLLRSQPQAPIQKFEFRGRRPVFEGDRLDLCLAREGGEAQLWARDHEGATAMSATATLG